MRASSMPMVARCIISALLAAAPASAAVVSSSPAQFTLGYSEHVNATPEAVWAVATQPSRWWSAQHSYSGNAGNFSLDAHAGGCWCERWGANSVEHARVVMALPGKVLRAVGGFGPLQQFPVYAVLSIEMKPDGNGTLLRMTYAAAGDLPGGLAEMAPGVDGVLGAQFAGLVVAISR